MVVESCFASSRPVHERYDLKGSWIGRGGKILKKRGEVLKDLDVRERFHLAPEDARRVSRQLREDIDFLASNNVIDYSLLVGVTKTRFEIEGRDRRPSAVCGGADDVPSSGSSGAAPTPFHRLDDGGLAAAFVEGPELYSMGIIDILQDFNLRKRAEYAAKRFLCCRGSGVSVHPPAAYGKRFVRNVVEALLEPVADGSVPRVYRGFTPAGSPLSMPVLVPSSGYVCSSRSQNGAEHSSRHVVVPIGASRSRAPKSADLESEVGLLSSSDVRSDDARLAVAPEMQMVQELVSRCPAPRLVVAVTRRCTIM